MTRLLAHGRDFLADFETESLADLKTIVDAALADPTNMTYAELSAKVTAAIEDHLVNVTTKKKHSWPIKENIISLKQLTLIDLPTHPPLMCRHTLTGYQIREVKEKLDSL